MRQVLLVATTLKGHGYDECILRVDGRKSGVTAAVYQGNGAEEVCYILFSRYGV
jgi:hypothetical protein